MTEKKDHCTWFPERWLSWNGVKIIDISDCCEIHDEDCSTSKFAKCLRSKKIVGALIITVGGAIGCWAKYTSKMIRRV